MTSETWPTLIAIAVGSAGLGGITPFALQLTRQARVSRSIRRLKDSLGDGDAAQIPSGQLVAGRRFWRLPRFQRSRTESPDVAVVRTAIANQRVRLTSLIEVRHSPLALSLVGLAAVIVLGFLAWVLGLYAWSPAGVSSAAQGWMFGAIGGGYVGVAVLLAELRLAERRREWRASQLPPGGDDSNGRPAPVSAS